MFIKFSFFQVLFRSTLSISCQNLINQSLCMNLAM